MGHMKHQKIHQNILTVTIAAVFFWVLFFITVAWSVMRYNYAKIPHDISIANSIEAILVMEIIVAGVPFMFAIVCTYRAIEILANEHKNKTPIDK